MKKAGPGSRSSTMRPQRPSRGATPKAAWLGCIPWVAIFTLAAVGGVGEDRSCPVSLLPKRCAYQRAARTSKPRPPQRPALALQRAAPPGNRTSSTARGGRGWTFSRSALRSVRATADHRRRRPQTNRNSRQANQDGAAAARPARPRVRLVSEEAGLHGRDGGGPGQKTTRHQCAGRQSQDVPVLACIIRRPDGPGLPRELARVLQRCLPQKVVPRGHVGQLRAHQPNPIVQLLRPDDGAPGGGSARHAARAEGVHARPPKGPQPLAPLSLLPRVTRGLCAQYAAQRASRDLLRPAVQVRVGGCPAGPHARAAARAAARAVSSTGVAVAAVAAAAALAARAGGPHACVRTGARRRAVEPPRARRDAPRRAVLGDR